MMGVQYAKPGKLEDATALLASLGAGASIIAGGQELMPTLNYRVFTPSLLIDINALKELRGVEIDDGVLSIGALCVHRQLERDPIVIEHAPLLAHALAQIGGGWQVRNRGTIGGNIVSMHPLYDSLPALMAYGASVVVARDGGSRTVGLSELLTDSRHGLGTEAILARVLVPIGKPDTGWGYCKIKNTHGAYASATAAALAKVDDAGAVVEIRLVVGSVEPLPRDLSPLLSDGKIDYAHGDYLEKIGQIAVEAITNPISDQRGDAEYRRALAGVSARRAVAEALKRASRPAQA